MPPPGKVRGRRGARRGHRVLTTMNEAVQPGGKLGATLRAGGVEFRLWAPEARETSVVIEGRGVFGLDPEPGGYHAAFVPGVHAGDRYRYLVDGRGPYPDPASRYQPAGVRGPSEVCPDGASFPWRDQGWQCPPLEELVLYELHVGAFTPEGTFDGVRRRLACLRALGVTAVELMPVADFAGSRNWGYDAAALFAPARCYGAPDDLRRLVNDAHRLGLAVFLDVVYNHFGPGAYVKKISKHYVSRRHGSPWGPSPNLDEEFSEGVRRFLIENAVYWVEEFHFDGLRLDATGFIHDASPRHFVDELAEAVRRAAARLGRRVILIAEDHRDFATLLAPQRQGGWGLDGVWVNGLHHELRRRLTGERHGPLARAEGSAASLARELRLGLSRPGGRAGQAAARGPERFVVYLENHDLVGNRPLGERFHASAGPAAWRAASALLLLAPQTPLIFMGQEWAASTPFLYFTDHRPDLGRKVAAGRLREYRRQFGAAMPPAVPDPQRLSTFTASRLRWDEREEPAHRSALALYRALLGLRRREPAFRRRSRTGCLAEPVGGNCIALRYRGDGARPVLVIACLEGPATVDLRRRPWGRLGSGEEWRVLLSTEEQRFTAPEAPAPIGVSSAVVRFERPGAVALAAECGVTGGGAGGETV